MKTYFLISLIPYFWYVIYKARKSMHMLQQNWYNDGNRYFKWILDNITRVFITYDLLFIFFVLFKYVKFNASVIIFSIFYIIVYFLYKSKIKKEQSKKPLVITARIKRLYVTMLILYLIGISPMLFLFNENSVYGYYTYIGLIAYLNPFIVMVANIINKPVEKLVYLHYKRQAKTKLYSMKDIKKIGITGSYGKTSTKNFLNDILSVKYNSFATPKSFNTMYGLINAINNYMDKFSEVFIAEMGAFKIGEIKEKAEFVKPKYAILTTIGTAHLESFKTHENIQKAKFELIDSLPSDGLAILNKDDEYQTSYKIKSKCNVKWVSTKDKESDLYINKIKVTNNGTKFTCKFKDIKKEYEFETKLLGIANIYNISEAILLAYNLGMDIEQIQIGVKRIKTIEHRLELKKFGNINIIDDAYNSNPVGSKMAVDVLGLMDGKKIIVTPGMIELGSEEYSANMEFGRHIASVCDEVILIGEHQTKPILDGLHKEKYSDKKIHILNDVKEAFPLMRKLSDGNTYVLLENDLPDIFNE